MQQTKFIRGDRLVDPNGKDLGPAPAQETPEEEDQVQGARTDGNDNSPGGTQNGAPAQNAGESNPASPTPATGQGGQASQPSGKTGELPTDFPGYNVLAKAKITTYEKVREASDQQLKDLDGIADKTLAAIRAAQ
ncbi:hypothetical protein [Deinococcus pimensis]|uniref:hypothetical protein n=1 Tax=Deinococcus pimensis TaxID=309888 RepID=UPI0004898700|nr:hypothetical protein [Deinococcus pimensis]